MCPYDFILSKILLNMLRGTAGLDQLEYCYIITLTSMRGTRARWAPPPPFLFFSERGGGIRFFEGRERNCLKKLITTTSLHNYMLCNLNITPLSLSLSLSLSLCVSSSLYVSFCLSVLFLSLSVFLSFCLSLCVCVCVCLSLCLSVCLFLSTLFLGSNIMWVFTFYVLNGSDNFVSDSETKSWN